MQFNDEVFGTDEEEIFGTNEEYDYEPEDYNYDDYGVEDVGDCSDYGSLSYYCVPYYQCDDCNTVIVDGKGLFDERDGECATSKNFVTLALGWLTQLCSPSCVKPTVLNQINE